jgi:hypothetical protein
MSRTTPGVVEDILDDPMGLHGDMQQFIVSDDSSTASVELSTSVNILRPWTSHREQAAGSSAVKSGATIRLLGVKRSANVRLC